MNNFSAFGAVHLGYIVVQSNRRTDWRRFGADAIGLHVDGLDGGVLRFRLDDRTCRFLIEPGPAEDVTALGWQIDDDTTFDRIVARVADCGVPTTEGTPAEAALRGVERLWRFVGPKGIVQEIFTVPVTPPEPLRMLSFGWVAGEAGLGHVVITSRELEAMRNYYSTVFDYCVTPSGFDRGRLESGRHRPGTRIHLGAWHIPRHQHLGPYAGGGDRTGQVRPVPAGGPAFVHTGNNRRADRRRTIAMNATDYDVVIAGLGLTGASARPTWTECLGARA